MPHHRSSRLPWILALLMGTAWFLIYLEEDYPVFTEPFIVSTVAGSALVGLGFPMNAVAGATLWFVAGMAIRATSGFVSRRLAGLLLLLVVVQGLLGGMDYRSPLPQGSFRNALPGKPWWMTGVHLVEGLALDPSVRRHVVLMTASTVTPFILLMRSTRRFAEDMCQRCGYALTGNVSDICPECGTPVDYPEDACAASTFRSMHQGLRVGFALLPALVVMAVTSAGWALLRWSTSFAPPGDYDLVPSMVVSTSDPDVVLFKWAVTNGGKTTVPQRTCDVALFIDGRVWMKRSGLGSIAPAEKTGFALSCLKEALLPGRHRYRLVVDSQNRVHETDETNNAMEGWFEIPEPAPNTTPS